MDIPRRAPDFRKRYPDRKSFLAAQRRNPEIASAIESHKRDRNISIPASFLEMDRVRTLLKSEGRAPDALSARRVSERILLGTHPRIVSECHGRIENLLLTVPWFRSDGQVLYSELNKRHYQALFSALGKDREYTVLCHPLHRQDIDSWFPNTDNVKRTFCLSPVFGYSIWAQDAYVALSASDGRSILAEGVLFTRSDDMTIADDVALQSNVGVLQSTLYFQGGNILGGDGYTLVGEDYVFRNETRFGTETRDKVLDAFRALFGTEIIPLGGFRSADFDLLWERVFSGEGYQPLFHIDMYVTPTGVRSSSNKEIVLLGRPSMAHQACGRYSDVGKFNNADLDRFFDETEEQLSHRFEVRHLPLFLTYGNPRKDSYGDTYYWLTFNNAVLENSGAGRNVVMPTYSQDSREYGTDAKLRQDLEQAAEDVWKGIGYEVHRMDGLEDLAYGLGSIHCITKTLMRAPPTS